MELSIRQMALIPVRRCRRSNKIGPGSRLGESSESAPARSFGDPYSNPGPGENCFFKLATMPARRNIKYSLIICLYVSQHKTVFLNNARRCFPYDRWHQCRFGGEGGKIKGNIVRCPSDSFGWPQATSDYRIFTNKFMQFIIIQFNSFSEIFNDAKNVLEI